MPETQRPCFPPKICYQAWRDSPNRPFSFGQGHQGPKPTLVSEYQGIVDLLCVSIVGQDTCTRLAEPVWS